MGLLTTITAGYDRVSIHGVRRTLLHAQVDALGLPLYEVTLQPQSSNETYERVLGEALGSLRERMPEVRRLAFGDISLADVRQYREDLAHFFGFGSVFPLWDEPSRALAEEVLGRQIVARLVCVDTEVLPADYVGRAYDASLLDELPSNVDPCGERGEFHTFVSQGQASALQFLTALERPSRARSVSPSLTFSPPIRPNGELLPHTPNRRKGGFHLIYSSPSSRK